MRTAYLQSSRRCRLFFLTQQQKHSNLLKDFILYRRGIDMWQKKSQVLIEFALIFPLFLLLVVGIIYFGSLFSDYMTLSSIARSSAREASVITLTDSNNDNDRKKQYNTIRAKYEEQTLPLDILTWNPKSTDDFDITYDSTNKNVVVTMNASLNENGSMFAKVIDGLSNQKNGKDFKLNITYTMVSEENIKK